MWCSWCWQCSTGFAQTTSGIARLKVYPALTCMVILVSKNQKLYKQQKRDNERSRYLSILELAKRCSSTFSEESCWFPKMSGPNKSRESSSSATDDACFDSNIKPKSSCGFPKDVFSSYNEAIKQYDAHRESLKKLKKISLKFLINNQITS